jgi:hypothetical protein
MDGYISFSNGKYRVIVAGLPLCIDKESSSEAESVAQLFKVTLLPELWNGDKGAWDSRKGAA